MRSGSATKASSPLELRTSSEVIDSSRVKTWEALKIIGKEVARGNSVLVFTGRRGELKYYLLGLSVYYRFLNSNHLLI